MTRLQKLSLLFVVALGFGLRFGGLNHDLNEWQVYHPDTPKQIRAIERFLDGRYYYHSGSLDYDAYPYFNLHLVEYVCRAGNTVHGGVQGLLGLPVTDWRPDYYQLFWITRVWNALLATWLILIVFQLARENWDLRAAFAAALFLAVSPADVVACHFAGADTTAGFFATVAVFFAFRIYRKGRLCDYALAALFTACGFSTKYHAGMAVLPILLAHGLRMGTWRALINRQSLSRLLLLALVGIPATFLTTPTLLTHCTETVGNIVAFFTQISSYRGVDESIRQGGWSAKIAFAMHRNLPNLAWIIGPLLCLGAMLGFKNVLRRHPDPRAVILYALPLIYFLLGVSLRPMAHPIYHTLMTPLVFVAAAVVFTRPFGRPENDRVWLVRLRLAVIVISFALLLKTAAKEVFFFWHQDVGRVAKAWAEENIPPQFAAQLENYSFSSDRFAVSSNSVGMIWAATRPEAPPAAFTLLKTFSLETERMAVFRNIPIRLYANSSAWLRPDFSMPIPQRTTTENGNRVICDNRQVFYRSEKLLAVEADDEPTVRWVVRTAALDEAWIGIQNGSIASLVDISFGGSSLRRGLGANEIVWWHIPSPRKNWPNEPGHFWYRWSARSFYGHARILLATRPEEMGLFLFNAGNYRDAFPFLQTAAGAARDPLLAALALISLQQAALPVAAPVQDDLIRITEPLQQVHDGADCRRIFGIAPAYLEALDFTKLENRTLRTVGCYLTEDVVAEGRRVIGKIAVTAASAATNPPPSITTPFLQLDPGAYSFSMRVRGVDKTTHPLSWRLVASDLFGKVYSESKLDIPPLDDRHYNPATTLFQIPFNAPQVRIMLKDLGLPGVMVDQIEIKPDVLATIYQLQQTLQHPMKALGSPSELPHAQKADTVFEGGLRFVCLRYNSAQPHRGQSLILSGQLQLNAPGLDLGNLAVFIHFVDESGQTIFQGDFGVPDLFNSYPPRLPDPLRFYKTIKIPANIRPGDYAIHIGVCRLDSAERLRIISSPLPQKTKAVVLQEPLHVIE